MKILGISCFYHDSAAALIIDGKIIAAAQEERFTRKKHDPSFPANSIKFCLKEGGININDLDQVVFYEDPKLKFKRLLKTYVAFFPKSINLIFKSLPSWLLWKRNWKKNLLKHFLDSNLPLKANKLSNNEHHLSHAASAFYCSPYDRSSILVMDGVGEFATTSLWNGEGNKIEKIAEVHFPDSLGLMYSTFTSYLGFKVNSGEYKVMGLAPYGQPKYVDIIKNNLISLDKDKFKLNQDFFDYAFSGKMFNKNFCDLFGHPARSPETKLTQFHMDVAASLQSVTEEAVLKLCGEVISQTKNNNLCLAGGVALNCVANGRILREMNLDGLWIQPASGDAGGAIGAALNYYFNIMGNNRATDGVTDIMQGSYLGPKSSESEILSMIQTYGADGKKLDYSQLIEEVSDYLIDGKVIGWHQGRSEFGPRALGNRSILGDPRNPKMQKIMNLKIKYRESFRPFAPAVLEEYAQNFFNINVPSPYMMLVASIVDSIKVEGTAYNQDLFGIEKLNQIRSNIPAVTHVDYSARVQTVSKTTNPKFHDLISTFYKKSETPVLVNTSFNVRGEPIVTSAEDSYKCFMRTEMDVLVIENYIFLKSNQPNFDDDQNWEEEFELD